MYKPQGNRRVALIAGLLVLAVSSGCSPRQSVNQAASLSSASPVPSPSQEMTQTKWKNMSADQRQQYFQQMRNQQYQAELARHRPPSAPVKN